MDLARSSYKLFLMKGGRAILLFLAITFFARQLDSSQLGSYFLFKALLGILSIPADFGIRGALEKRLSEGESPENVLGSALALKLAAIGFMSVIILATQGYLNEYIGAQLALPLIALIIVNESAKSFIQVLRGELRVGETAAISLTWRVVWIGVGAGLVLAGYGIQGIVVGHLCGGIVTLLWAFAKCETRIGRPTVEQTKSILDFSKFHAISSVGGRMYQWMDVAIIGLFLTQSAVSAYEVAWQVTLLVLMLSESISLSLFPQVSTWSEDSATERIESAITTAIGFALFVSIPALVGGGIYSDEILRFMFGPEYTIAGTVLIVLLVEKLFQSFHGIVGSSVRAIDRPDLAARATVITVGVNLVLSPVLVVSIGLVGAAIATALSWLVNTILHTIYLSRFLTVDIPYRLLSWYAVVSVFMGAVLVVVKSMIITDGLLVLMAQIALGIAIYGAVSLAVPDIRNRTIVPGLRVII